MSLTLTACLTVLSIFFLGVLQGGYTRGILSGEFCLWVFYPRGGGVVHRGVLSRGGGILGFLSGGFCPRIDKCLLSK